MGAASPKSKPQSSQEKVPVSTGEHVLTGKRKFLSVVRPRSEQYATVQRIYSRNLLGLDFFSYANRDVLREVTFKSAWFAWRSSVAFGRVTHEILAMLPRFRCT